jgi:hypothetical protein
VGNPEGRCVLPECSKDYRTPLYKSWSILHTQKLFLKVSPLTNPQEVYNDGIKNRALEMKAENPLPKAIRYAADSPPADYITQAGWVLIAFQNAAMAVAPRSIT